MTPLVALAARRAGHLACSLRWLTAAPRRAVAGGGPLVETGRIDDTLWTSHLSASADTGSHENNAASPSARYAELVQSGAIQCDAHQLAVVADLDELWAALPGHQRGMALHADDVALWLADWEAARDALVRQRVDAANRRGAIASRWSSVVTSPIASAVRQLAVPSRHTTLSALSVLVPAAAGVRLSRWADVKLAEKDGVLIVHEDDIDAAVGRPCPEPPEFPRGMYLHGGVGTGKSLCMDLLFASSEDRIGHRRRVHFNSFMLEVHQRLHAYNQSDDARQRVGRIGATMRAGSSRRAQLAAAMVQERHDKLESAAAARRRAQADTGVEAGPGRRAPLKVDGVEIVGRTGDARPTPLVRGRDIHDPFSAVARELLGPAANGGGLLCFDELQVNDPFNAVAIREIFLRLLEMGVIIVTTSNRELHSLNRWKSTAPGAGEFQPLVDAMTARCRLTSLDAGVDYRRAGLACPAADGYVVAAKSSTGDGVLDRVFAKLREDIAAAVAEREAGGTEEHFVDGEITALFGRKLTVPEGCWRGPGGTSRGVARFSFEQLCGAALGATHYAVLAAEFSVLVVDNVPRMGFESRSKARRFITLVDELYNRRVRLVCSAAVPIDELFDEVSDTDRSHAVEQMSFETEVEGNMSRFDVTVSASVVAANRTADNFSGEDERFAFSRAASRLHEMQTAEYNGAALPSRSSGQHKFDQEGWDPKVKGSQSKKNAGVSNAAVSSVVPKEGSFNFS